MSAAASAPPQSQPALKSCGFTRAELIDLLKQADKHEIKFERYFFTRHADVIPGTALPSNIPRCLDCGCTIAEHGTGIVAVTDGPLKIVKALLDPRKTENTPSAVQTALRNKCCCVCNKVNPSCAHLLRTRVDAAECHVPFDELSNFLPLCGTKGSFPSCHDAFDTKQLCFVAIPDDDAVNSTEITDCDTRLVTQRWLVVTRDSYSGYIEGKKSCAIVFLDTAPSRRILHAHALLFWKLVAEPAKDMLFAEAKSLLDGFAVDIKEWLEQTTPPQMETLTCNCCSSKRDLFLDKDSTAYCVACWVKYGVCDICPGKTLSSEAAVKSHFQGRTHQKQLLPLTGRATR
jgi:hypothetical protein